jgi:hypothetical protein
MHTHKRRFHMKKKYAYYIAVYYLNNIMRLYVRFGIMYVYAKYEYDLYIHVM